MIPHRRTVRTRHLHPAPRAMAKRAAAGTLALAVCLTGGVALAATARADRGRPDAHRPATLAERSEQLLSGSGR